MDSSIYVAKTKALISCAVTVQLICVFVFAYMQKAGFLMTRLNQYCQFSIKSYAEDIYWNSLVVGILIEAHKI